MASSNKRPFISRRSIYRFLRWFAPQPRWSSERICATRTVSPRSDQLCGHRSSRRLDFGLFWLVVFQILFQEEVQERADEADGRELPYLIPRGRDRCANDIGGQLKFKSQQQPDTKAQPDIF